MKTIKETLIGTMKNGKNILNEIAVSEKVGKDFSLDKTRTQRIVEIFNEISALRACKVKFQSRKSLLDIFYEQTFKIIAIFAFEEYFPVSDDDNFFHVYVRVA